MKRRSLFTLLGALLAAPFTALAVRRDDRFDPGAEEGIPTYLSARFPVVDDVLVLDCDKREFINMVSWVDVREGIVAAFAMGDLSQWRRQMTDTAEAARLRRAILFSMAYSSRGFSLSLKRGRYRLVHKKTAIERYAGVKGLEMFFPGEKDFFGYKRKVDRQSLLPPAYDKLLRDVCLS